MKTCVSNRSLRSQALAVLLLCAGPAAALAAPWDPARAGLPPGWTWAPPQSVKLPGARLQIRHFQVSLDPVDAARWLTRVGASRFDRLQFSGPVLSLSGMYEGRHWLAQLRQAEGGGTIGLLSSLSPERLPVAGFDPAEIAPSGARPVLRAASRLADGSALLATYLCPGPYPRVAAAVRRALQARHWKPMAGPAPDVLARDRRGTVAAGEWMHPDGARLTVHISPRADAVSLTFWHRSKEPS
jgi:hypothetical protein